MNEFDIIEKYFVPLTMGQDGCAALKDDAALVGIPDGHELVVTSDTLNEGVHFLPNTAPEHIAKKALRVNLSDLAAMGANPLCYQLNLAFASKPSQEWLAAFSAALHAENVLYGIYCSGGDTTSIMGDCLSVSITAMGVVSQGRAVRRGGARDGDFLVVTDFIGDAALGLKSLREGLGYVDAERRYRVPEPRVQAVEIVRKYAHGAADISDGLLADSVHIAKASGLGVEINPTQMLFSKDVQHALDKGIVDYNTVLSGGDDYELVLAVSKGDLDSIMIELKKIDLNPYVMGCFSGDSVGLSVLDSQRFRIDSKNVGWKHF